MSNRERRGVLSAGRFIAGSECDGLGHLQVLTLPLHSDRSREAGNLPWQGSA
ncbi:hypothetical protein AB6867_26405 [Serratia proteamaculans]|uniref:hypothetical protein n=1 Tax=Serratia proteamaculans TaxID=28151 RepID=UPI0039BE4B2D